MNIKMHEYEIQMQLILIQYVWTKQNWINWFNWCCVLFHQYFWQFSHSGISYNKNTNTHIQISNEEHKSVGLVNQLEGLVGRDYKSFAGASEDRLLLAFGSIWTPCNLQIMVILIITITTIIIMIIDMIITIVMRITKIMV